MKHKLVVATNNAHKLEEIKAVIGDKIEILSLADIDCHDEIPEDSDTLEGNALQKAQYIYKKYGVDVFADDTGLEVKALNGRPGVHTARYAYPDRNDTEANVNKILAELEGAADRSAQFRTAIALILKGVPHIFEGKVEGYIATERRGTDGFGYDPVFSPEDTGKTFSELGVEVKNQMSHRSRAVNKLCDFLLKALLWICPLFCLPAMASSIDEWTTYFSYFDASDVQPTAGDKVYAIMSGNLLSYDTETQEVFPLERGNCGLSDVNVSLIGYSDKLHKLVIIYSNGNIDIYNDKTEEVTNIPQFRDNPDNDFSLNSLTVDGDYALLSTNEGFLWLDLKNGLIKGRFPVGACFSAAFFDNKVYAALKTGELISIDQSSNLLDMSLWTTVSKHRATRLAAMGDYLYFFVPYVYDLNNGSERGVWAMAKDREETLINNNTFDEFTAYGDRVMAYLASGIIVISKSYPLKNSYIGVTHGCNKIVPDKDNGFWTAKSNTGICHYVVTEANEFKADASSIGQYGPRYDNPYFLRFVGTRLYMAGGKTDPLDADHRPYMAAWLDDEGNWVELETPTDAGGWLFKRVTYFQDATSIVEDVQDKTHHFVTSGRHGVFEYRDGKIVAQYTQGNSPIESCSASKSYDYVRTDAGIMDAQGNLFVANNNRDTTIWCRKPSGEWIPFYYAPIANAGWFERSIFDQKGRLWVAQRRNANGINGGFLCLDYNGTVDNPNDDVYTYRDNFYNEDGTAFTFQAGNCLAEDRTGRIWLGTDTGLLVVDNPDDWTKSDFLITQVKVPRNDGTNYADYLLNGAVITAIAVDGADRKWIGTQGDGIYLVSSDGTVTLHHFTTDNSPLVSNTIWSIACHPKNGEVFIGTDVGLVSYHSDASESESSLSRDNLRVYPNPVRPDYSGPIVLDGLVYDADVKVMSTAGHVVAAGTSIGGTFTWDGRGPSGERVGSGVYYFLTTSADGKESVVAKVAIVR